MSISKIMVSAALAAGLMVVGINGALAADTAKSEAAPMHAHEPMDPAKAAEHMQKKLGLTDDQKAKVEDIIRETQEEGEKIRAELKALHQKTSDEFKAVLTEEQFKKWEANHMPRHHKNMK